MASPGLATDFFDQVQAQADAGDWQPPQYVPYRHMVDVVVSGSKGDNIHEPLTAKLRIDPSLPPGERVTILQRSEDARGEMDKALDEMIEEIEDEGRTPAVQAQSFWCNAGGAVPSPDDFEIIDDTETHIHLRPTPERRVSLFMQTGDRELDRKERSMAKKLSDRLDGAVVYNKETGRISSAHFHITRPMTVLLIAKIREMKMTQGCTLAPNGHPYVSSFQMDVRVTALGQTITNIMDLTVGDLELISDQSAQTG